MKPKKIIDIGKKSNLLLQFPLFCYLTNVYKKFYEKSY